VKKRISQEVPKIEYRKILYTTDLSESGRYAFSHAASLANRYEAELTALHVVEGGPDLDSRLFGYVDEKLWDEIKTRNLQEARDLLISRKRDNTAIKECVGQFCDDVQAAMPEEADVTYSIEIEMGDPVDKIIDYAETGKYDLIVMGSHGHGLLKHAIMGDTVKRVVQRSEIPVLVVRVPEGT
jgi:nucleotide-binding universal stress UspA family protein